MGKADETGFVAQRAKSVDRVGSRLSGEWIVEEARRGHRVSELRGAPVLPLPEHVLEAVHQASVENLSAPSQGLLSLREAISTQLRLESHVDVDPDGILITNGAMHALYIVLTSVLEPGEEVLLYSPAFFFYGIIELVGGIPVYAPLDEEEDFRFDVNRLQERISPRTKAVLVNTPVNPTGYVATLQDLQAIAALAERHNLLIISDESYDRMVYSGQHYSICSIPEAVARGVTIRSFTKSYALPQWRIGYVATSVPGLAQVFRKVLEWTVLTCNYVTQKAALAVLTGPQEWIDRFNRYLPKARDTLLSGVRALPGVTCVQPAGGPYLFPNISATGMDSVEFAHYLLEEFGVPATPGVFFQSDRHVRIPFAAPEAELSDVVRRLSESSEEMEA